MADSAGMTLPDSKPLPYRVGSRVTDPVRPHWGIAIVVKASWAGWWRVEVEFPNKRRRTYERRNLEPLLAGETTPVAEGWLS